MLLIGFLTTVLIVICLFLILHKKMKGLDLKLLVSESTKMVLATLIPSVIVYYLMKFIGNYLRKQEHLFKRKTAIMLKY